MQSKGNDKKRLKDNYGRLFDFLKQISKLSYFNLLDLADFLCIISFPFRFLMLQLWLCANTAAHLSLQYVHPSELHQCIGSSGGFIDHTGSHKPVSVLSP